MEPLLRPLPICEAHFGNGFTRRLHLLRPISDGKGGFFRCLHSQTLNSLVCEMGMVRMDPARIRMSVGGEAVESVIGRSEEEELPVFGEGAFVVDGGGSEGRRVVEGGILERFAPKGDVERHTMRDLMESVRVGVIDCGQWIEEPTLLVTRFEYANLFHTITDWYSAYVSSRVTNLTGRPHLVFVDGHCKAPLEETWEALFSSVRYAKSFTSPVCFRHVILSPLGYETALFKGLSETIKCEGGLANDLLESPNYHKTARLTEFGEMLRSAFDLPKDEHHILKPASGHNVLFIRREDYLAHPRHNGKVESRLSNEEEVYDALKIWASDHSKCEVNLVNGRFAHMKMKEQLRAIQEAQLSLGLTGQALEHRRTEQKCRHVC
ncbi:Beta-(1,2)-xylosyltransferase [Acorus calamus]|uniref:Beta-(1,2)-xylosyltransferase n=1 Tax=Acorus calamus TaxID=4465 RepID=A0AAV9CXB7_ACOCL|nr:Beta-(1,2)-xylosyltransferase [Acorus calamus]